MQKYKRLLVYASLFRLNLNKELLKFHYTVFTAPNKTNNKLKNVLIYLFNGGEHLFLINYPR